MSEALRESPTARLQAGRERVKAAGGRLGGQPVYGFTAGPVRGTLVPHPDEAPVAWLMAHLDRQGWTVRAIADELDRLQLPTRSGRPWHFGVVHGVVARAREARAREADTG